MDDVNSPENDVNQPGGAQPTAPSQDGGTQQPATPASTTPEGEPAGAAKDWEAEAKNLQKALKQERERYRQRSQQQPGSQTQVDETLFGNPEYQKVMLENATYKLKEEVKEVIERYPNLPKSVVNAITRNPRGFVQDGTTTIEQGLWDIEDYINELLAAEDAGQPLPQPKPVQIAQNNAGGANQVDQDAELQAIADIPPEDWTAEQEAKVNAYMKSQRAQKK